MQPGPFFEEYFWKRPETALYRKGYRVGSFMKAASEVTGLLAVVNIFPTLSLMLFPFALALYWTGAILQAQSRNNARLHMDGFDKKEQRFWPALLKQLNPLALRI